MADEFAIIPFIEHPIRGDITGWLKIGAGYPYTDCYVATSINQLFKIAYYRYSSSTYQCVVMTKSSVNVGLPYQVTDGTAWTLTHATLSMDYGDDAKYYTVISTSVSIPLNPDIPVYDTDPQHPSDYSGARQTAIDALYYSSWDESTTQYPITYRLTNAITTGPSEAAVGDTVTVPLTFPEGYGVVNPSTDVYVTCNGESVSSTYSDGQLVFTMPDPS